jgi:hypothetical protein
MVLRRPGGPAGKPQGKRHGVPGGEWHGICSTTGMRTMLAVLVVLALGTAVPASAQLDPACAAFSGTRLRLRKLDWPLGGQRVLFRGTMPISSDVLFDPSTTGMRFLMTDDAGAVMSDVTIPGSGWVGTHGGISWAYVDREGIVGGLRRVLVRRSPTTLKVYVNGQDITFSKPAHHVFVHTYFTTDQGGVLCGNRYFHELGCTYRNSGGKLNCH